MIETTNLRCEYAVNPLGIDAARPRLMWMLEHPERGQTQTAYQVQAATTPEALTQDAPDLWDSGKVSAGPGFATYGGPALHSGERCYWQVRAWDAEDRSGPFSAPAWFEMGLLSPEDWEAEWIGFPASSGGRAIYLRREFSVQRSVARARAYVAGLGYYELRINGVKVGDHVLDPGATAYDKRVLYVTYDVTAHLVQGGNVLACVLGSGWYGMPKLLLRLVVEYEDGTRMVVTSGNSSGPWRVEHGPIVEQSIYNGEVYDARLERPGWDTPQTPDGAAAERPAVWVMALVTEGPGGKLVPQLQEPIRVMDTLKAESMAEPQPGVTVLDFGQNMAGWARLRVEGPRGTRITLRFAESLYADGTVNQENLRSAAATDVYVLKGEGVEEWEPRFTYHGFRYVQVEGYPGVPKLDDVVARVVRSSMAFKGSFACDNALLNRIHRLVQWTEISNVHSIPTDCPQRDERMGWLNDMAARSEELVHTFEVARFLPKWLNDIADAQDRRSGAITDTVPFHWGSRPADPVSVCYLLIPWLLYLHNGDVRVLAEHYDGMRRWLDFLSAQMDEGIVRYSYYGDWAPPVAEGMEGGSPVSRNTPGTLVSTALTIHGLDLFARMAGVLGKETDRRAYGALAERSRAAYNARFWDEAAGGYGSNNQACNAISLYMGLVPPERRSRVLEALVRDVAAHDFHLTTGNLCTKYLLEVLTAGGYADVAARVALQESYPSWGFMLANGATTVWERWELATGGGMNSHNHPMYASVGAWLYRAAAGLTLDEDGVGWTRFTVCPHPVPGLTHVEASLETIRGRVAVAWTQGDGCFELEVTVPVGSQARVRVPAAEGGVCRIREGKVVVWGKGAAAVVPGVLSVKEEGDRITLVVGSGVYRFLREG